jgi:hypothetical protein
MEKREQMLDVAVVIYWCLYIIMQHVINMGW